MTLETQPRQVILIAVSLFLFFIALSPGWLLSHDAGARLKTARQIWLNHTVFIDENVRERYVETPHGITTYFGLGQVLSFIPFDILGYNLKKLFKRDFLERLPLLLLYAPIVGLLWWWAMVSYCSSMGLNAIKASALFVLTTISLVYITQTLQEEALIGACLLFAIALFQKAPFRSGLLIGFAFLCRLNVCFSLLVFLGFAFDTKSTRQIPRVLAGVLCVLPLFLLFNYLRFQNIWETGYGVLHEHLARAGTHAFRPVDLKIAFSLLFGLGKGFFILSPPLLIALYGVVSHFREHRYLWCGLLASVILSVLFHSKLNGYACGGHCWGGRFQVHLIGFFVYPFCLGIKSLWLQEKSVAVFLLSLGFLFQIFGCMAPESLEYFQEISRRGDYQEKLVTGTMEGQLPLRMKNILAPENDLFTGFRERFIPNVWGLNYSKFYPNSRWSLYAWSCTCFLALFTGFLSFRRQRVLM